MRVLAGVLLALLAGPAVAQPFIVPLGPQRPAEPPPPPPSPVPIAPPQADPSPDAGTHSSAQPDAAQPASPGQPESATQRPAR